MLHQTHIICDAYSNVTFNKWHNILIRNQLVKKNHFFTQYFLIKTKYTLPFKKILPTLKTNLLTASNNHYKARIDSVITKKSVFSFLYFDCHFLKKEKLYTKLKYSRSPQYDIVSGGVAALVSAFIGFLVSEKFGIELVDSGDFYVLFMYLVFIVFSLRPLVKIITKYDKLTPIFSFMPFITLLNYVTSFLISNVVHKSVKILTQIKVFFKIN